MRFYHPEILALLFLLIIPILIHLFQLQRFKKEAFTNVKFLKEIELESRKSQRIKRILILITRLLAFTALVFAFAQPYLSQTSEQTNRNTIIYFDNSLSLQSKGENGVELLQSVKSTIVKELKSKSSGYTLITNNGIITELDAEGLKKEILDVNFYPTRKSLSRVLLEAGSLSDSPSQTGSEIFLFSDFRDDSTIDSLPYIDSDRYFLVPTRSEPFKNIVLDSVWLSRTDQNEMTLKVRIQDQGMQEDNLSISLILNDKLFGKTSVSLESTQNLVVDFNLPAQTEGNGVLTFNDRRVSFDNTLFFTLPKKVKSKVLVIGEYNPYFSRIYNSDDFELVESSLEELDQGQMGDYDLVLINELNSIPSPLAQSLKSYVQFRGNLVIIPSEEIDIYSYRDLFTTLALGSIRGSFDRDKLITTVNYDHPFFKNVFRDKVTNFQYPKSSKGYETNLNRASSLLEFEDRSPFISEIPYEDNHIYWVSSSLKSSISNFVDSPLIVPVFYNFSLTVAKEEALYRLIGRRNEVRVKYDSISESPIKIVSGGDQYIPLQKNTFNQTILFTSEYPDTPGIFELSKDQRLLSKIAFNYDRETIRAEYMDLERLKAALPGSLISRSLKDGVNQINDLVSSRSLWQLFTIFALIFLILEMLIQRFFKN